MQNFNDNANINLIFHIKFNLLTSTIIHILRSEASQINVGPLFLYHDKPWYY